MYSMVIIANYTWMLLNELILNVLTTKNMVIMWQDGGGS